MSETCTIYENKYKTCISKKKKNTYNIRIELLDVFVTQSCSAKNEQIYVSNKYISII